MVVSVLLIRALMLDDSTSSSSGGEEDEVVVEVNRLGPQNTGYDRVGRKRKTSKFIGK